MTTVTETLFAEVALMKTNLLVNGENVRVEMSSVAERLLAGRTFERLVAIVLKLKMCFKLLLFAEGL